MKLNNRRTVLVGLAFLSICAFWQMYDNVIPLVLTKTFHLNETFSGTIMAADNILALFLLPFFGTLSDRTNTKLGKRTPYIIGGTAAAVILLNILPVLDNSYYKAASTGKMVAFIVILLPRSTTRRANSSLDLDEEKLTLWPLMEQLKGPNVVTFMMGFVKEMV